MLVMTGERIDPSRLREELYDSAAGAYRGFEGRVRNHNEGPRVLRLEDAADEPVAIKEGARIIAEAGEQFAILKAMSVHRTGMLEIGDCAVWVGVSAAHRDEAFKACRFIIDALKHRLPIWKKEYYASGDSGWVNCERCATHAQSAG